MHPVVFKDVWFSWPAEDDAEEQELFRDLSLELPAGFGFVVGPNGIGKSTMMLLAAGRIFPDAGTVSLLGTDTRTYADAFGDPALEQERNLRASFVYQNMEFETEEPIEAVFAMVCEAAADPQRARAALPGLLEAAGLSDRMQTRMHELSKGEMQRAIVVMSLLYGSPVIFMDEPVFAVEPARAEQLLAAVRRHCAEYGISVWVSVHDVELARRFADLVLLFDTERRAQVGPPEELLSRERLEDAFRAPYDTLYARQNLYRELLTRSFSEDERVSDDDPTAGGSGS